MDRPGNTGLPLVLDRDACQPIVDGLASLERGDRLGERAVGVAQLRCGRQVAGVQPGVPERDTGLLREYAQQELRRLWRFRVGPDHEVAEVAFKASQRIRPTPSLPHDRQRAARAAEHRELRFEVEAYVEREARAVDPRATRHR